MQGRSRLLWARLCGALAVLAVAAVVVASAHSTTHAPRTANLTAAAPPQVEDETGQKPDSPDIYQDFKDSSGQDVTERAARAARSPGRGDPVGAATAARGS